jgi:hypothetical protein
MSTFKKCLPFHFHVQKKRKIYKFMVEATRDLSLQKKERKKNTVLRHIVLKETKVGFS